MQNNAHPTIVDEQWQVIEKSINLQVQNRNIFSERYECDSLIRPTTD